MIPRVAQYLVGAKLMLHQARTCRSSEQDEGEIPLLAEEHRAVFCARVDPRTSCGPGTPIRLSVDPHRFHFFDPETGQALTTEPAAVASA